MSNDAKDVTSASGMGSRTPKSAPAELRVRRWGVVGLVLLTTLAVGSISLWLVPPYWLIMVWLLAPPGGWRRSSERSHVSETDAVEPPLEAEAPPLDEPELAEEPEKPAKPARRKRVRAKKKVQEEPPGPNVEATWVRVGPNQFVRVEVPVEPEPDSAAAESIPNEASVVDPAESDPGPVVDALESADPEPMATEVLTVEPEMRDDGWLGASCEATMPSAHFACDPADLEQSEPVVAEQVERRFDVVSWRVRSWRPEHGWQGLEPNCRPFLGLRTNSPITYGFSHDQERNEFRPR